MNTTIEVVCFKYTPLKNNKLPLKLRITQNRKRRYISLGVFLNPEHWDFIKNKPKPNCPDREHIEQIIANKAAEFRRKALELKSEKKEYTASSLVDKVVKPTKALTVGELFVEHISTLKESKRMGYAASLQMVYNCMMKFNKHLNIYFSDIDVSWLKKYEAWLRKADKAENSIGVRFRTLRMLYNLAIEREMVKVEYYPFRKYKVSKLHQDTLKRSITKAEIASVINYPTESSDMYTKLAIDIFTFSYLMGGINFVDIAHLTKDNIIDGKLVYIRRKTSKRIILPMQPKAERIASQYDQSLYLFPILSSFHQTEQQKANRIHKVIAKVNKVLTGIGEDLDLPLKLTTYVARHSFATVLKRAGVPTPIISESLGHSSEKVTQIYLNSFENKQIGKAMENLL